MITAPLSGSNRGVPGPLPVLDVIRVVTTRDCFAGCDFCDFSRRRSRPETLTQPIPTRRDFLSLPRPDWLRISGGLNAMSQWDDILAMISSLSEQFSVPVQGLSAPEIDWASQVLGISLAQLLDRLKQAGLSVLGPGGADVLDDGLRTELAHWRIDSARWIEIHRIAHARKIPTAAGMMVADFLSLDLMDRHLSRLAPLAAGFHHLELKVLRPNNHPLSRLAPPGLLQILDAVRAIKDRFPDLPIFMRQGAFSPDAQVLLRSAGVDRLVRTLKVVEA